MTASSARSTRSEDPRALAVSLGVSLVPGVAVGQGEDPHGGVVVVEHVALGGLSDQFLVGGEQDVSSAGRDLPLRCSWQGDAEPWQNGALWAPLDGSESA